MTMRNFLVVLLALLLNLVATTKAAAYGNRRKYTLDTSDLGEEDDYDEEDEAEYEIFSARERSKSPMQIGEHHNIRISNLIQKSDIKPTISQNGKVATYVLQHEGSPFLSVHFALFHFADDCAMEIRNVVGDELSILTGHGRSGMSSFWAKHVAGDTMHITVECTESLEGAAFDIDGYVAGIPEMFDEDVDEDTRYLMEDSLVSDPFHQHRELSICGRDDKRTAACFAETFPVEYQTARAVARIYINGGGACTGWLVSDDLLLTNEHCIGSRADALNSDFEFMAEDSRCYNDDSSCWFCSRGRTFDAVDLVSVNSELDYALVRLAGSPGRTYGYLELETERTPNNDETIYIPQHPGARPKMLALYDSSESGSVCRVLNQNRGNCGSSAPYSDVRYTCDTEGGTSGSPVISRETNKVIALHHCGGACGGNMGVPAFILYDHIQQFMNQGETSCPTGTEKFVMDLATSRNGRRFSYNIIDNVSRELMAFSTAFKGKSGYYIEKCLSPGLYSLTLQDSRGRGIGTLEASIGSTMLATGAARFGSSSTTNFVVENLDPTNRPTQPPTKQPTNAPTSSPSVMPSDVPSGSPTLSAAPSDSTQPSGEPTVTEPSGAPSAWPSMVPSVEPSGAPSSVPSESPTAGPQDFLLGQCTTDPTFTVSGGDCGFVADNTNLCPARGSLGRALDKCQDACRCHSGCVDDPTWSSKRRRGCEWVAQSPERRCGTRSRRRGGPLAFEACEATCGCTSN